MYLKPNGESHISGIPPPLTVVDSGSGLDRSPHRHPVCIRLYIGPNTGGGVGTSCSCRHRSWGGPGGEVAKRLFLDSLVPGKEHVKGVALNSWVAFPGV